MIAMMTYDKYAHMMTLIVNSRKKYENDNAKENKMHATKSGATETIRFCVCVREINE